MTACCQHSVDKQRGAKFVAVGLHVFKEVVPVEEGEEGKLVEEVRVQQFFEDKFIRAY